MECSLFTSTGSRCVIKGECLVLKGKRCEFFEQAVRPLERKEEREADKGTD